MNELLGLINVLEQRIYETININNVLRGGSSRAEEMAAVLENANQYTEFWPSANAAEAGFFSAPDEDVSDGLDKDIAKDLLNKTKIMEDYENMIRDPVRALKLQYWAFHVKPLVPLLKKQSPEVRKKFWEKANATIKEAWTLLDNLKIKNDELNSLLGI